MWIRSQDREVLVNAEAILVSNISKKDIFGFIGAEKKHGWLGAYATEKRALEVLDEIQSHLNKPKGRAPVFEMPKE